MGDGCKPNRSHGRGSRPLFYIGIGEGSFGEDPHPVHGTQTSDGGYVVGGKSLDAGGAWEGFVLKVVPSGFSGYLNLNEPSEGNQSYARGSRLLVPLEKRWGKQPGLGG